MRNTLRIILICFSSITFLVGCSTTQRTTQPKRAAVEQLLISESIIRSLPKKANKPLPLPSQEIQGNRAVLSTPAHTIDMSQALSRKLTKSIFVSKGSGSGTFRKRVSKTDYDTAVRNADSGHPYDAFMAALAYRVGGWSDPTFFSNKRVNYGKDNDKYFFYLNKAAKLGWPEAHFYYYDCHEKSIIDIFPKFQVEARCLKAQVSRYNYIFPEGNSQKAAWHLQEAKRLGWHFDKNFNYVGPTLKEKDSISTSLEFYIGLHQEKAILAKHELLFESKSINKTRKKSLEKDFNMFPNAERKNCKNVYRVLAYQASKYQEPKVCGENKYNKFRFKTDKFNCPGLGFNAVRNILERCMASASSDKDWNFYFFQRVRLYHTKFDKGTKLFDEAIQRFTEKNEPEKVQLVMEMKEVARKKSNRDASYWAGLEKGYQARIANRPSATEVIAARKRKKAAEERRSDENFQRRQQRLQARMNQFDPEQEAAWAGWKPGQSSSMNMDNIERMKNQTMREINASQRIARASQASSSTSGGSQRKSSLKQQYQPTVKAGQVTQQQSVTNRFDAEKANCIKAGKRWTGSSCDYSGGNIIPYYGRAFTCDSLNITEAYEGQCEDQRQKSQAGSQQNTNAQMSGGREPSGNFKGGSNNKSDQNTNTQMSDGRKPSGNFKGGGSNNKSDSEFTDEPQTQGAGKEAWAYCWENKLGRFSCDGPLQLLTSDGRGTLQLALEAVDCDNGVHTNGNWYDCQRKLKSGFYKERDVREKRQGQ